MKDVKRGYMKLTPWGWQVMYGEGSYNKTLLMVPDDCKDFEFTDRGWIFFSIINHNGKKRAKLHKKQ